MIKKTVLFFALVIFSSSFTAHSNRAVALAGCSNKYDATCPSGNTSHDNDWLDILEESGHVNLGLCTKAGTVEINGAVFDKFITPGGNIVLVGGLGATGTLGMRPEDFADLYDAAGGSHVENMAALNAAVRANRALEFWSDPVGFIMAGSPESNPYDAAGTAFDLLVSYHPELEILRGPFDVLLGQGGTTILEVFAFVNGAFGDATPPDQFIDDVRNGSEDSRLATISPGLFRMMAGYSVESFFDPEQPDRIFSSIFYIPGGNCALINACDCVDDDEEGPPPSCDPANISTLPITSTVSKSAPLHAVVVGQDDARRGADIIARVTVPPIVYTWYEAIPVYRDDCRVWRTGDGTVNCRRNASDEFYTGIKERVLDHYDCIQHVEVYEDRVVSMNITARLSNESQSWITDDLGHKWYLASVKQAFWSILPGYGSFTAPCDGSKTCFGNGDAFRIPFADPGSYILTLTGSTSGTPVSLPRTFNGTGNFVVNVILVQETGPQ